MITLFLFLLIACMGAILFASATIIKIALFALDKLTVFIASCYYMHTYFSTRFSSGYAVYFWDILGGILAVGIYSALFQVIHTKFCIVGKILNFVVSLIGAMTVYCLLTSAFITDGKSYFVPLLNHNLANQVVNYILIGILSFVVWRRREEYLRENEGEASFS